MRISLLALAVSLVSVVSLCGCFVVPSKTTTTRNLGTERSEMRPGVSRGLAITTSVDHSRVIVQAIRKRDCKREIYAVTEITDHRGLRMGGVSDPRGAAFGAILAPVTLPISLLVSSISLAGNMTSSRMVRKPVGIETSECSEVATGVAVLIELASGEQLTRRTDQEGTVALTLPPGEPYRGVIKVRAEAEVTELKYHRKTPAVTAVREAVTSCAGAQSYRGSLEVRVDVDAAGLPTKVDLDHADETLTTCITTQIAEARFPAAQRDTTLVLPFSLGE